MTTEADKKQMYRIEKQVRKIIESFADNDIEVSEAVAIVLSLMTTMVTANSISPAGVAIIADEFERFVTYLRTGVLPEDVKFINDGEQVTEH